MPLLLPKPPGPANIKADISPARFQSVPMSVRFDDSQKQEFIGIMTFFAYQAKEEGRFDVFEAHVHGRFLGSFPEPYAKNLPAHISMTKAKIRSQLKGACHHQKQVMPRIHWENFLALEMEDILKIGRIIKAQSKDKTAIALKRTPALRQDAEQLVGKLNGRTRYGQHAAAEVPIDPKRPEGPMRTLDVSDDLPVPPDQQTLDEHGELLELVIDLTIDDDDSDSQQGDSDYVQDSEDDMYLDD